MSDQMIGGDISGLEIIRRYMIDLGVLGQINAAVIADHRQPASQSIFKVALIIHR
ncbi:hypothetical protein D9M71_807690 [compost metagenome]